MKIISPILLAAVIILNWPALFNQVLTGQPDSSPAEQPQHLPATDEPVSSADKFYNQVNTIFNLLNKLDAPASSADGRDEAERQDALAQLVEIGPSVIPFIMERLKDKGIYVELTRQIMERHPSKETKITPAILEELARRVSKNESLFIDKYLYSKYLAAQTFAQREQYQPAIKLINSILELEPQLEFSAKLKQFRIACEEKLIQKSVIKTKIFSESRLGRDRKEIYEMGDKINITLQFENVTLRPVDITFGEKNSAVIYLSITEYGPTGNYSSISRMEEIPLSDKKITLNPKEIWQNSYVIDTDKELRSLLYRIYTLGAEIRPLKIEGGGEFTGIRKIVFPQIILRVFPPDVDPVLKEPLAKLGEALDGGMPLDIFLCSMLVSEKEYEQAIEMLMTALRKSSQPKADPSQAESELKQVLMNSLKHITQLPFALEEEIWLTWWKEKNKR
ncbi:MAG: hypothetical protein AAB019_00635 [Planctomycetota bacterium]